MTKLQKLRDTLEQEILGLKEAWANFEKERKLPKSDLSSEISSDHLINLVKLILEVVSVSNNTLSAYSHYTAALEKKLYLHQKKNGSKNQKKSL